MASVKSSTRIRIRVILLSLLPVFLIIMLVTLFLASSFHLSLSRQNMKFGNTMADQIALTSTEYLINQDSVSLNVILRDLLSSAYFEFAAIYDADGSLITQAGKSARTQTTFTRDITSQNTVVGHLSLGLTTKHFPTGRIIITAMLISMILGIIIGLIIWFYGSILYLWITGTLPEKKRGLPVLTMSDAGAPNADTCWLTIRLEPDRLVNVHRKKLEEACLLYSGEVQTRHNDLTVAFNNGQHIQNAICCGLLIKVISELIPGNINFKAGIAIGEDEETTPKHAAYLSSISDQQLLVSKGVRQRQMLRPVNNVQFREYKHSLTGKDEVYVVTETDNNTLIRQQAIHLCENFFELPGRGT